MTKQEHGTQINQRVRLKLDGQDNLYVAACAGSVGWIRKQDHDSLGYPRVFIEWDKNHWSYNGESDGWALDAHFEPAKDVAVPDDNTKFNPQVPADMAAAFAAFMAQYTGGDIIKDRDAAAIYLETLEGAHEAAKEADAFLLIAVRHVGDQDGYPVYSPTVLYNYKDDGSGLILEAQLSRLAALSHEQVTHDLIKKTMAPDES